MTGGGMKGSPHLSQKHYSESEYNRITGVQTHWVVGGVSSWFNS